MSYPGNPDLSAEAKEKVITTFRRVVRLLQEGKREEAQIGLEFCLRLDPSFGPGVSLQQQFSSGEHELDLSSVLSSLAAPSTEEVNLLLVDAVEDYNSRRYFDAKEKVEKVLQDLPGHQEARQLLRQIDASVKVESQVAHFLLQARETFDGGDPQEAANFVMMAQALDPHHPGISAMLAEINAAGGGEQAAAGQEVADLSFEPVDEPDGRSLFDDGASTQAIDLSEVSAAESMAAEPATFEFSAESLESESGFGGGDTAATVADTGFAADVGEPSDAAAGGGEPSFDFGGGGGDSTFEFEAADDDWGLGSSADSSALQVDGNVDGAAADSGGTLFDLDGAAEVPEDDGLAGLGAEDAERIRQLLAKGELAFDSGRYQDAIDTWSRVFLIDPANAKAGQRIEAARARQDEVERTIEHLLYEAKSAIDAGRNDEALRTIDEVLDLQPNQLEAVELRDRLGAPLDDTPAEPSAEEAPGAAQSPAMPSLPDLDADLFEERDRYETAAEGTVQASTRAAGGAPAKSAGKQAIPIRLIAAVVAGLVVVALGVWFGSQLISGGDDNGGGAVVEEALAQARELKAEGRVEDAIALLQSVQVSGLDQTLIKNEIDAYQKSMVPPTPTPIPSELVAARRLFDEGRWLEAYRSVQSGLSEFPRDGALRQLEEQILEMEPAIGALYRAEESGDSVAALAAARQLADDHPDESEYAECVDRHLFNTAVDEIKSHNLAGGTALLEELMQRRPDDDEARQVLDFVETYKRRPSDMQLKVFTSSLSKR